MTLRFLPLLAALLAPGPALANKSAMPGNHEVVAEGALLAPGSYTVTSNTRLSQLLATTQPAADAYLPGLALHQQSSRLQQVRLRAGLQHDLDSLEVHQDPHIAQAAAGMSRWLQDHPASGRVPLPINDMRLMQVQKSSDPILEQGDVLRVPRRPATISVVGAVESACELAHQPLRDALDYLQDCAVTPAADRNDLYIVQPDMTVQKVGIALWNRADPHAVAPGGIIFVPLHQHVADAVDSNFNAEFAAFIATQALQP
ncbi:capsule biosynthesis GfcC family protein [Stenotrophomonas maltophilia]|nr:capsule biosynthesis GfcC family protein [Stenotrophomonas maltophilia]